MAISPGLMKTIFSDVFITLISIFRGLFKVSNFYSNKPDKPNKLNKPNKRLSKHLLGNSTVGFHAQKQDFFIEIKFGIMDGGAPFPAHTQKEKTSF
jgi:hypothetical protein